MTSPIKLLQHILETLQAEGGGATDEPADIDSILALLQSGVKLDTTQAAALAPSAPITGYALEEAGNLAAIVTALGLPLITTDNGPAWIDSHGVANTPFVSADQSSGLADVTDAPVGGKTLVVTDIFVSVAAAMTVIFTEETTGILLTVPIIFNTPGTIQLTPRGKPWRLSTADTKLQVGTNASGLVNIDVVYHSET